MVFDAQFIWNMVATYKRKYLLSTIFKTIYLIVLVFQRVAKISEQAVFM